MAEPVSPQQLVGSSEHRRVRFRFSKMGKIRFTSHRDVARMWERALRRSRLPVALSQGFSPHPLLSFGLALPTGCESHGEYLDARLESAGSLDMPEAELPLGLPGLPGLLTPLLPDGVVVQAARVIEMAEGSLQQEVGSCDWELEVHGVGGQELRERVERMLAAPSLTIHRERKGRQTEDDIRPAILTLARDPGGWVGAGRTPDWSFAGRIGNASAWGAPRRPDFGVRHRCGAGAGL